MPVRKVHGSWWTDFCFRGVRHRQRSPDNTRMGAQAYESTLRAALARGEHIDNPAGKAQTFGEFAWRWFDTYACANNKPSEVRSKRTLLRVHLVPRFGHLPLSRVFGMAIETFKSEQLAKGLSPKTVNNHLAVLRRCLRCAEEWGAIGKAPTIKALRAMLPPLVWYDRPEQERLLVAAQTEPGWAPMVHLALRTGMRRGELLGLDWEDINWERRTVCVRRSLLEGTLSTPKNHRIRYVPLSSDVATALAYLRLAEGPVFRRPDGRRRAETTAELAIRRIVRRAGLRPGAWHALRHSYATLLAQEGVPLPTIMKLLGHSSIAMTMRYVHVTPAAMQEATDALERAFGDGLRNEPRQQAVNTALFSSVALPVAA